jgi:integrase
LELFLSNVTPRTQHSYRGYLSHFYSWGIRRQGWTYNPALAAELPKWRKPGPKPVPNPIVERAIEHADEPLRTLLMLAYKAGLRRMEALSVTMYDIDMTEGRETITVLGKGRKTRTVPLHRELVAHLRARDLARGDRLVPMSTAFASREATNLLTRMAREAGSRETYTLHNVRHSFGTNFYRKTKDLLRTRDIMGHSTTATTEGYAKADHGDDRRDIDDI